MVKHRLARWAQGPMLVGKMAQSEGAVTAQVNIPNLYIGLTRAQVVLFGKLGAQVSVATFIVNGLDLKFVFGLIVEHRKKPEFAHQLWRQVLGDKALILEILHGKLKRLPPV